MSFGKTYNTFLQWLDITSGRDKLLRFVQYFSRLVIAHLEKNSDVCKRLDSGQKAIGSTRKLIRFFRTVEFAQEAINSLYIKDDVERVVGIGRNLSFSVWMFIDHIQVR